MPPTFGQADLSNRRIPPAELVADDSEVTVVGVLHEAETAIGHGDFDGEIILRGKAHASVDADAGAGTRLEVGNADLRRVVKNDGAIAERMRANGCHGNGADTGANNGAACGEVISS